MHFSLFLGIVRLIVKIIWLCCVNVWFCGVSYKPTNKWILLFTWPLGGSLYFLLSRSFTLGIFSPGPLNVYVTFNSAPVAKQCLALTMKGNWEEIVCLLKLDHLLITSGCCSTVAVNGETSLHSSLSPVDETFYATWY